MRSCSALRRPSRWRCAWSGSVCDGTTSKAILLRLVSWDLDRVGRLAVVSVEVDRASAGGEFHWRSCPLVDVVGHAVNGAEPEAQHRDQIGQFCREVIAARPPRPVHVAAAGRLRLQSQPWRVNARRLKLSRACSSVMATLPS